MNGVPICGRCYNALRRPSQPPVAPPTGHEVVSDTATTQQLVTGPAQPASTSSPRPAGAANQLIPAAVPFSQAAVPMEQVFQGGDESENVEEPAPGRTPPPTSRESARRTGLLPAPAAEERRSIYVVGAISAASSFILVFLGYLIFRGSKPEPKPEPEQKKPVQTYRPQLPSQPTLPPPVDPTVPSVTPPAQSKSEQKDFDAIWEIPAEEKEKRAAAFKAFYETHTDAILVARARREYEALRGPVPEPPVEPATKELKRKAEGLRAEYFSGRDLKQSIIKQVDLQVSLDTKGIRPSGVPRTEFSARWQGYLYVEKEGTYTLATFSDDGVRVQLNGRSIIDNWGDHGVVRDAKTLILKPGYHALKIEYYQGGSDGELILRWSLKDGFDERMITTDNLFHESAE